MSRGIVARTVARTFAWMLSALLMAGVTVVTPPAAAKGDDVCPEANDTFQAACFLGAESDALGFISRRDDVDAYRFEIRDYGASVRVSLPERPLPYRVSIANWNGQVVASDPSGTVQARLDLPGSYYAFVDSPAGQFNDGAPYRIEYAVTYASQPVPQVVYTTEFRGGARDVFTDTGTNTLVDDVGEYTIDDGRISIKMTASGSPEEPLAAKFTQSPEPPDPGPIVEDFTMTIDARVIGDVDAGYIVLFRHVDGDNFYELVVSQLDQQVSLSKFVDGERFDVVDWVDAPMVVKDGVNRTVIRAVGNDIRVNINGKEALRGKDGTFKRGLIGYGAVAYGEPPTVNFDNILVTTPTRR